MREEEAHLARLYAWRAVLDRATYYDLLGIPTSAPLQHIKEAWHRFALAFHPDGHMDDGPDGLAASQDVFQRGAEAYLVLKNPALRARYDLALAKGQTRLSARSDAPPPPSKVKTLEDLSRSAAAKMSAQRADDLISTGDLREAQKELRLAIYHDGGSNAELEERLEALDLALFARGD